MVRRRPGIERDGSRVAELEQELEATRTELQGAIHNLETSNEDQKAINEEALSVQEEYQSTNEELLTSKEELQSLNEELTALNSQLQETLERQRTTSNDLQNVLYSTDVATLFLDASLNIRFFTPMTKALFNIIPERYRAPAVGPAFADGDGWRPAGRSPTVLRTREAIEREIETENGSCYMRRVLPYRTQENSVAGVVITFSDITERRRVAVEIAVAKRHAELANAAKSRFLAAASHDLRQPLQTLMLVQGLLAKHVDNDKSRKLIARLEETLQAMSGMLNTLLDINQIEAGTVHAEMCSFPVGGLLEQLREEFAYHAQAKGISLRVVHCGLSIESDPRLLEQMVRNLVSNALKYTKYGKVLLGCRRRRGSLSIEIWDTGIGIAPEELKAIFEEYHQVDNPARERSRGLGLGLSIVHRLGHCWATRSTSGRGPDVVRCSRSRSSCAARHAAAIVTVAAGRRRRRRCASHRRDPGDRGRSGCARPARGVPAGRGPSGHLRAWAPPRWSLWRWPGCRPDVILADYNLPDGMNGVQATTKLREALDRPVPAIILTGDISIGTLSDIALRDCVRLSKPVKLKDLTQALGASAAAVARDHAGTACAQHGGD